MTIYILSYQHNEHGNVVSYHGSKRSAKTCFAADQRIARSQSYCASDPDIRKHVIASTKKGVLAFLNRFTPAHDNG